MLTLCKILRFGTLRIAALVMSMPGFLSFPVEAEVDHEGLFRSRLVDVRERLERRVAHREMLSGQIDSLSMKLDQINRERKEALSALAEQVDRTRSYQNELDRLVPRLLPRLNKLDGLRKQGAHTISGLANVGRDGNVGPKEKARLLAVKAASISQMRRASTSIRLLRRLPNDLISKHRDLNFELPLLAGALDRVSQQQGRLQRQRDSAIRSAADLSSEIERLTAEEHRLARSILARSLNAAAGFSSGRRFAGKIDVGHAQIKSAAVQGTKRPAGTMSFGDLAGEASPSVRAMARALPGNGAGGKAAAPTAASQGTGDAGGASASFEVLEEDINVVSLQAAPLNSLASSVPRRRLNDGTPLVPTRETISYSLADVLRHRDEPSVELPATPRQRVAAPDDGVVVFANDFRSYGLLLIIEHDSEYHTLLWGFSSLDIRLGDRVRAGQIVGSAGTGQSPKLHVELRRNGEPVSPEGWLAASNSGVKG